HHDWRPDRDNLINIAMSRDGELDAVADEALHSGRSVVGAQNQFVAAGPELIHPEQQFLGTKSENADHIGAILFKSAGLRENWCDAQAATDTDDLFLSCERARYPHGPNYPKERGPYLTELLHLLGRLTHRLHDQGNRTRCAVEVRDSQRDPFTGLMRHDDDELTWPRGFCHQRMMDDQGIGHVGEIFAGQDFEPGPKVCID